MSGVVFLATISSVPSSSYIVNILLHLHDFLEGIPLANLQGLLFMHDGAPPQYTPIVVDYLNITYGDRWIASNRPTQ